MKLLNKSKRIIPLKNRRFVVIEIIEPPKYFIGDIVLTEYDARRIQKQVAEGDISYEIANELQIKDEDGKVFEFREDGRLVETPKGYDITSKMVLSMIGINRKNNA